MPTPEHEPRTDGRPLHEGEDRLEALRREVRSLDAKIVRAIVRRMRVAEEIGHIKRVARIPLRDFEVEAHVRERLRVLASAAGVEESLGSDLALFLIRKAIEIQSPIVDAVYDGDRLRVLVVGGAGGMGRWIGRFLNSQGHRVEIHDTAPGGFPFPRVADLGRGLVESDLVFVAVPMSSCAPVLLDIASRCGASPPTVVEICSLKSHLAPALDEVAARGLRVVSLHPMFGPDVRMLSDRRIVLCRRGDPESEARVRRLFEGTSARIVEVDFEDHDRFMALVLGMSHLANLAFGDALARSGISVDDLDAVAGVTFLRQVATTREVVSENPALYWEIQALNPATREMADRLVESLRSLLASVESGSPDRFERILRDARDWFSGRRTRT
jgi:chorismate mutase/prephenate dehydrogenase